jgi:hypothetical protein
MKIGRRIRFKTLLQDLGRVKLAARIYTYTAVNAFDDENVG